MANTIKIKFKATAAMKNYHNHLPAVPNFKDGEANVVPVVLGNRLLKTFPYNFTKVDVAAEKKKAEQLAAAEAVRLKQEEEAAAEKLKKEEEAKANAGGGQSNTDSGSSED